MPICNNTMDYQKTIREALEKVVSEHGYRGAVRNRDIHEQSLAHRLAYHMETSGLFAGYHIDCEYNRRGENPKTDADGNYFRPDIVVHVRGNDDSNLIMIETKKFNDPPGEVEELRNALVQRKQHLNYQFAFIVIFPENIVENDNVIEV